ncbi:MAG: TetR/AcrR family transcriptional regulator, partial [Solobacterium sp.]|nr:TetR/AcrR family transcriptional regulator [Solobacterium sp.]
QAMKEQKTKKLILQAASAVFFEKGYEDTTVRDILEASGVSTGSFYHFFSSKEELFEAVVSAFLDRYVQDAEAILTDTGIPVRQRIDRMTGRIYTAAGGYYDRLGADRMHAGISLALHVRTVSRITSCVCAMLETAIADGEIEPLLQADAHVLAAVLVKGVEGIIHADPHALSQKEKLPGIRGMILDYISLLIGFKD